MSRESHNPLRAGLSRYLDAKQLKLLADVRIGIAGAGGLGSNAAMMLARSGVEKMLIADSDVVEPSNLNRQQFWPRQLGQKKVFALGQNLREVNSHMELELLDLHLDRRNLPELLPLCPIWIEALDNADTKAMFVELALLSGRKVAAASGLCGFGGLPMAKKRLGNLVVVGDFCTGMELAPPLAPRVTQAAALLADSVLEFVLL